MARRVADQLAQTLEAAGVERVWGIVGDSLNGFTEALRTTRIRWMHVRHEEVAGFAAGAEAQMTGKLAVCAGSCGPGNLHLINGLFDCHRNRVPVLAIAAQIPSPEIGGGYFQETHPEILFRECSHYCELISQPAQMPRVLEIAMRTAIDKARRRGRSCCPATSGCARPRATKRPAGRAVLAPTVLPPATEIDRLAQLLNGAERVTLLCGAGCAGARDQVLKLADAVKAPIVHTLRGKEYIEHDNPFDVGMTGLIGFSSGYHAMLDCDLLLMLGTDFPYRQFYPTNAKIAQIDLRAENLGRRTRLDLGLIGDVAGTLAALLPKLAKKTNDAFLAKAQAHYRDARKDLDELAVGKPGRKPIHPQYLAKVIDEVAAGDAVFTCDVGETTVWAARYLHLKGGGACSARCCTARWRMPCRRRSACKRACPGRQVVSMSGDGGFTMLMGDMLSLRQLGLPVKIVVFNNGLLGFVDMEMKAAGFLNVWTGLDNPDFAKIAQAAGMAGYRVEDPAELKPALEQAFAHEGPALVDVVTAKMELVDAAEDRGRAGARLQPLCRQGDHQRARQELIELARTNLFR